MNVDEYARYDAVGLAGLVRAREVDAREVIEAAEQAVRRLDPHLNFMTAHTPELVVEGLEAARCRVAPFGGVPFLVKEGHGVRGQAAAMGCRLAAGINATAESEIVARYRRGGLVILGCTNVSELGSAPTTESVLHGACRNPWNPDLTAGGSSGGAAAAVAAGVVPAAHASDGGGSVRIPAHCCGLVGLKPTRGRTPVGPAHDGWPFGYTSQHIVSRTVRDSAALLDITRGHEDGALFFVQEDGASFADAVSARLPRLRIALATASPYGGPVHPDCVAAAQRAARLCETLGHRVEEAEPPVGWEAFADAFAIGFCLTRDYVMNQLEERSGRKACLDTLEPLNWAALQYSRTLTSRAISEAATTFNTVRRSVARFFAEHDVLITPTAARPAWRLGELSAGTEGFDFPMWGQRMLEYAPFTQLQNVTGQPAISLPLHHGAGGLPAGAHLVGRFGEEGMLLSLAADLEEACPWAARRPAIHVLSQQGAAT